MRDHSTKNLGLYWFIYFICTRPFHQNIWSFFIYSFFRAQPFDQKLGSSLIDWFYLCTTIRPKYMVLFHLFFLLRIAIRPKIIRVLIGLFLLFVHDHSTKIRGHSYSLFYSFLNCVNVWDSMCMALLLLYFTRYMYDSTGLIFCTLYFMAKQRAFDLSTFCAEADRRKVVIWCLLVIYPVLK